MKNATILHGTGSHPNSFWHPWLKENLENLGYEVWLPQLPNTEHPTLKEQLLFVLNNGKFDKETVLVGHSSGCPLILSILENINIKINKSILIAGFTNPLSKDPEPMVQSTYNWNKIKNNCSKFIFINSDNDPWGCNDQQGRIMFDKLGGIQIIRHGDGHMGSDTFNQPYKNFPLLLGLIKYEE